MRTPLIALLTLAVALAGCTGGTDDGGPDGTTTSSTSGTSTTSSPSPSPTGGGATTHDVDIEGNAFDPATLTIQVGDTVRWTNQDGIAHTATSDDGTTFDTGSLSTDESESWTATQEGTFSYHCSFHGLMTGTITVEA
jgi:plastocyanin